MSTIISNTSKEKPNAVRLVDLRPRYAGRGADHGRVGLGIIFDCPHCRAEKAGRRSVRIMVWIANPLDGGEPVPADRTPFYRWQREGDTFETLTLTPSLNVADGHGHWNVTNGEVIAV